MTKKNKIGFNVNGVADQKAYDEFQAQFNSLKNSLENLKSVSENNYNKAIDSIYEYLSNQQDENNTDLTGIPLNSLECAGLIYNIKRLMKGRIEYFPIGQSVLYNTDFSMPESCDEDDAAVEELTDNNDINNNSEQTK